MTKQDELTEECFDIFHRSNTARAGVAAVIKRVQREQGAALTDAQSANERDRTRVADAVTSMVKILRGCDWMTTSRGCYEWDDADYQKEFGDAVESIWVEIEGLRSIAADWSNCPKTTADVQAARLAQRTPAPQPTPAASDDGPWATDAEPSEEDTPIDAEALRKMREHYDDPMGPQCDNLTVVQIIDYALRMIPAADSDGVSLIATERQRQVAVEGWTPEHDDEHTAGEMASAAATYILEATFDGPLVKGTWFQKFWMWSDEWFKPKDKVRDLTRAGGLIAAEIDRLLRASRRAPQPQKVLTPEPTAVRLMPASEVKRYYLSGEVDPVPVGPEGWYVAETDYAALEQRVRAAGKMRRRKVTAREEVMPNGR